MALVAGGVDRLLEMPPASSVALEMGAENYFDAVRAIVDEFAPKKGLHAIYVTATIPSKSILNALEVLEVDLEKVHFVDCVSRMMMGLDERHEKAVYVESPSMLENILLKVEFLIRGLEGAGCVVVLDSINSLSIHNSTKILSEFLHILVNHLRAREAYTVILSMEEYATEEIHNILALVADDAFTFSG